MDTLPVTVGKTFDTIEEVEETLKLLERDYYHPLRRFNSQTVSEYNRRREKAGSELRIAEQLKFVFILYRYKSSINLASYNALAICSIRILGVSYSVLHQLD